MWLSGLFYYGVGILPFQPHFYGMWLTGYNFIKL